MADLYSHRKKKPNKKDSTYWQILQKEVAQKRVTQEFAEKAYQKKKEHASSCILGGRIIMDGSDEVL